VVVPSDDWLSEPAAAQESRPSRVAWDDDEVPLSEKAVEGSGKLTAFINQLGLLLPRYLSLVLLVVVTAMAAAIVWFTLGMAGGFVVVGAVAAACGGWVLVTGRASWGRLPSRSSGAIVLTVGVLLSVLGWTGLRWGEVSSNDSLTPAPAATLPSPTPTPPPPRAPLGTGELHAESDTDVSDEGSARSAAALAALGTLEVREWAPRNSFDRIAHFGESWPDVDGNGCSTREDILARDLRDQRREDPCVLLSGVLDDPFTGATLEFYRGADTSFAVQVDHVVALSNAWRTGAQQLSFDDRLRFANDPRNLLAVDGEANLQKSDSDAAEWLPPNELFRCEYVILQIEVKAAYGLWVTPDERAAMELVLDNCDLLAEPPAPSAAGAPSSSQRP